MIVVKANYSAIEKRRRCLLVTLPFYLDLSTKSDTKSHTSCDNYNDNLSAPELQIFNCLFSWFSFLLNLVFASS